MLKNMLEKVKKLYKNLSVPWVTGKDAEYCDLIFAYWHLLDNAVLDCPSLFANLKWFKKFIHPNELRSTDWHCWERTWNKQSNEEEA